VHNSLHRATLVSMHRRYQQWFTAQVLGEQVPRRHSTWAASGKLAGARCVRMRAGALKGNAAVGLPGAYGRVHLTVLPSVSRAAMLYKGP
jgi:hypothetical protein